MKLKRGWIVCGVLLVLGTAAVIALIPVLQKEANNSVFQRALHYYAIGRIEDSENLCRKLMLRAPENLEARLLAARCAYQRRNGSKAEEYLQPMLEEGRRDAIRVITEAAGFFQSEADPGSAEALFFKALKYDPANIPAQQGLIRLLGMEGRMWEAAPYRYQLIRINQARLDDLIFLADPSLVAEKDQLEDLLRMSPQDAYLSLGGARLMIAHEEFDAAAELLREILALVPDLVEAQALLGGVLLDQSREEEFIAWHRALSKAADEHPRIWAVRGMWCMKHGKNDQAIRAFWEAVRRDPNQRLSTNRLAELLEDAGRTEDAQRFRARAERLNSLTKLMDGLDPRSLPRLNQAADTCEALGRLWEAWAWRRAILLVDPDDVAAKESEILLRGRLADDLPIVIESEDLGLRIDLSMYPLPEITG